MHNILMLEQMAPTVTALRQMVNTNLLRRALNWSGGLTE
jgi:hypothetical protein